MSLTKLVRGVLLPVPVLALCVSLASCTSDPEPAGDTDSGFGSPSIVVYDEEMSKSIRTLGPRGETRRLSSLTSFEWDAVYVYFEGTSAGAIEGQVGINVLGKSDYYYSASCLLVFARNGEVERAISVSPDLFFFEGSNKFSSKVRMVPMKPGKRTGLRLEDPSRQ